MREDALGCHLYFALFILSEMCLGTIWTFRSLRGHMLFLDSTGTGKPGLLDLEKIGAGNITLNLGSHIRIASVWKIPYSNAFQLTFNRNIFQSGRADGGETVRLALVPHMSSEVHVTEKYTLRFYKLDGYRVMSSLTRLISPSVCPFLGLTHVRNIMDIGGNSGEFLLQVLRCNEARGIKQGRIVDTDFIREYGRLNIRDEEPEWFAEGKIDYLNHTVCLFKGGSRCSVETEVLKQGKREYENSVWDRVEVFRRNQEGEQTAFMMKKGFDLIMFKWFLNDWEDSAVVAMLTAAKLALGEGKKVVVFEHLITESVEEELCLTRAYPGGSSHIITGFRTAFRTYSRFQELFQAAGIDRSSIKRHFFCHIGMTLIVATT
mmetsp:Transcript_41155/g.106359  ORF Transcript_41155/g.106359 Transcript_41155/m.106359 type:complete len:376 (-) Transcript_41155:156-1283(-)